MATTIKKTLSVLLCLLLLGLCFPIATQAYQRQPQLLYNEEELQNKFLQPTDKQIKSYENGCFIFPLGNAQLDMNGFYAADIYRQGGTKGSCEITLTVYDLYSEYGKDYKIYQSNDGAKALKGTPAPLYSSSEFSFIPVLTQSNSEYYDKSKTDKEVEDFQKTMMETAPFAAKTTISFADGENSKRIYIETLENEVITEDKQFNLVLSSPTAGKLGTQTTASYTIKETREKPDAYLSVADAQVNPQSEQAYVTVTRTGNLGKTVRFVCMTQAGTAKASGDYEATQMELVMLPTMTQIQFPVNMLPGAQSGKSFSVVLRNVSDAKVRSDKATVQITSEKAKKKTTAVSDALTEEQASEREYIKIDTLDCFNSGSPVSTGSASLSKHETGEDYMTSKYIDYQIYHGNGVQSDAVVLESKELYDFNGIDYMQICASPDTGSTVQDYLVLYAGNEAHIDSSTTDLSDWRAYAQENGGRFSISDISSYQTFQTAPLQLTGKQKIYLAIESGHCGWAGARIHTSTQYLEYNLLLHKKAYTLTLLDPDKIEVLNGSETVLADPAYNLKLTNPGATSKDPISTGNSTTIYRDETTTILYDKNTAFKNITFEGVQFVNPETGAESEVYPCSSTSLLLTPEILQTYADYIRGDQIQIKPVFRSGKVTFDVQSYDNTATSGEKFLADAESCTGTYYIYGEKVASVSWTQKAGDYTLGDTVTIHTKMLNPNIDGNTYSLNFYRTVNCDNADEAPAAQYAEVHPAAGSASIDFALSDFYNSVTPVFTIDQYKIMLDVLTPDYGTFTGAEQAQTDANGHAWVDLSQQAANTQFITITATPKYENYRCKWQYKNVVTNDIETYYGPVFYYQEQNAIHTDDNYITLSFEKIEQAQTADIYISGYVYKQSGSILNPPLYDNNQYDTAPGAAVFIGSQEGTSGNNGQFFLQQYSYIDDPDNYVYDENGELVYDENGYPVHAKKEVIDNVKTTVCADETYRALVSYQNSQYLVDIDMGQYINSATVDGETISVDVKLPYQSTGPKPITITATDTQGNEYVSAVPLVSLEAVTFSLYIDTDGELPQAPVNMVRWTIESTGAIYKTDEGEIKEQGSVVMSVDLDIDEGTSVSVLQQMLSEIAAPGDKMYIELMSKYYDDQATLQYKSYGRYETGYTFTSQSEELSVTYCPDVGVPSPYCIPTPVIGIITPTLSLRGFSPVYNIGKGPEYDGNQTMTITIGLNFAVGNDLLNKGNGWNAATLKDNTQKMTDMVKNWGSNIKNSKDLFGNSGNGVLKAMNLKTSIKCSISATVMFQSYYYFDPLDNGMIKICGSLLIAGGGFSIRFEWPFMLFKIPCFVYITAGIEMNIYMGIFPVTEDSNGNRIALTLDELESQNMSSFQGVYEGKVNLGVGGGIGFSGLLNVQGGLTTMTDLQFNDFGEGIGYFKMLGSITVQVCMLKYTWTSSAFVNVPIFDTVNGLHSTQRQTASYGPDLLRDVRLKDLKLQAAPCVSQKELRTIATNKDLIIKSSSYGMLSPSVTQLGNGQYFIAFTNDVSNDDTYNPQRLYYAIYDENNPDDFKLTPVMNSILSTDSQKDDNGQDSLRCALSTMDMDVQTIDTGEDILLIWSKANALYDKETQSLDMLRSIGIATVLYNKEGGYFHNYHYLKPDTHTLAYVQPKAVYDTQSGLLQLFYQVLDTQSLTQDSTLADLQQLQTTLETRCMSADSAGLKVWDKPQTISINEKYIKYYDAISVNGKNALAFIGSNSAEFTMDQVDQALYDEETGAAPDEYTATKNSMYLKLFSTDETGALQSSNNIRVTDSEHVAANPSFANVNTTLNGTDIHNLLLFYRENGNYVYQNITDLLLNGTYTDQNGDLHITENYMTPLQMTTGTDYTVNDDLKLVTDGAGHIYALFTVTEYDQQQIWASSFYATNVQTITQRAVLDENGNRIINADGSVKTEAVANPVPVLSGTWGEKTYLTQGSINDSGYGNFKKGFDCAVLTDGSLLTVYNAFDYDIGTENAVQENNMIVMSRIDTAPVYTFDNTDYSSQLTVSDPYPMPNHTVTVQANLLNTGIRTGRNITATLYANNYPVDSTVIKVLPAGADETITMSYLVPESILAEDISLTVRVSDSVNQTANSQPFVLTLKEHLSIKTLRYVPVKYTTQKDTSSKYLVYAYVQNNGNMDYTGGAYLAFLLKDTEEAAKMVKEDYISEKAVYKNYGTQEIEPIQANRAAMVKFYTDSIPDSAFTMGGGMSAYFETVVSDGSITKQKEIKAADPVVIADNYFPGLTVKNTAPTVRSMAIANTSLSVGEKQALQTAIAPQNAMLYSKISYRSSDPSVVKVDANGIITGVKAGNATITAKTGSVTATAAITVTGLLLGDVDGDGHITIKDTLLVQKAVAHMVTLTDRQTAAADVDGDKEIKVADVLKIQQFIAKQIQTFM